MIDRIRSVGAMRIEHVERRGDTIDAPAEQGDSPPGRDERTDAGVPTVAEYRATVDAAYRAYAIDQGCARVREVEENVTTPALRRIESQDPTRHLVGMEYRLKGEDRLTEKVGHDMQKRGVSAADAFAAVKDAIRYTFQYPDDRYAQGIHADVERLKHSGFELTECRNSWTSEEYKGINSRWREPETGQLFEIQFHTQASFEAKQVTHSAYEKLRTLPPDHAEVRELRAHQREVTAKIPIPRGAQELAIHVE
ncbi:MAG: hypothetical protein J2P29_04795 [Actinobacteria bacterium]|nr:hypothetical protein [Actinomycetota bacterium]